MIIIVNFGKLNNYLINYLMSKFTATEEGIVLFNSVYTVEIQQCLQYQYHWNLANSKEICFI